VKFDHILPRNPGIKGIPYRIIPTRDICTDHGQAFSSERRGRGHGINRHREVTRYRGRILPEVFGDDRRTLSAGLGRLR